MYNPYQAILNTYLGSRDQVFIDRADAPRLIGKLVEMTEFGCTIGEPRKPGDNPETQVEIFVAYEHIRGVGALEWVLN